MNAETMEAARAVALKFVGYAARSSHEIERRLAKDDYPPEIIAAIVSDFEARGWVDDTKFAKAWVEDRADRKKYGRGRLTAELRRKGIDKETVIEAVNSGGDEAEIARAMAAALSKWHPDAMEGATRMDLQAEKKRLAGFLQRRGFGWSTITQVLNEIMKNNE